MELRITCGSMLFGKGSDAPEKISCRDVVYSTTWPHCDTGFNSYHLHTVRSMRRNYNSIKAFRGDLEKEVGAQEAGRTCCAFHTTHD